MNVKRFANNPIIHLGTGVGLGGNINGPSLIQAPGWISRPLGRYYLYFAHHQGDHIRLAYSDSLEGPWRIYQPGTLPLEQSYCYNHIASPDVHVDEASRQVRMYYHGWVGEEVQQTKVALSDDGIRFKARADNLGKPYFRLFPRGDYFYALAMPGIFYRSKDGLTGFEEGPTLFTFDMRHSAVRVVGNEAEVYYTNAYDQPERILRSRIDLSRDWTRWTASEPEVVLEPEMKYEGVDLPQVPSARGASMEPVRQLRDPAIYQVGESVYLLYSVAGEQGIAIAELLP